MKTIRGTIQGLALLGLAIINDSGSIAYPQGTAFSYAGQLSVASAPANGVYDLQFTVYDALTNGNLVAGPLSDVGAVVSNGLFSTTLDFGTGVFTGPPRWLAIAVRTNGGGPFTVLSPRQSVAATPYSVFAGGVEAAGISGVIPAASAGVVAAVNGTATNLTVNGTFSGLGAGLTNRSGFVFADIDQVMVASNSLSGALGALEQRVTTPRIFNVRAYGAAGNGSADDSVAIKAAWNDLVQQGGTLYFPFGTYRDTNTYYQHGAGQIPMKIKGDGQYCSIWLASGLNGQVFVEACMDVSGLTFQDGSRTGFNVGYKNLVATAAMKLNDVRFLNWSGIGWETECAGAEGFDLDFDSNTIGLRLAGFADGGTFMGRLCDNYVGIEVGGTDLGAGDGVPQNATHGNLFRFGGPGNVYPYIVGQAGCCTIEGYLEGANNVVSVGYPPEVATLIPGITEVNDYTYSVVVQNLGGFGGMTNQDADAVVAIYSPSCLGVTVRNSSFTARTCVLSKSPGGDATPVILEHAVPGGPVMTFSDGTTVPAWLPANVPHTGEINISRRVYSGTNLIFDVNSAPYPVGQTDPSWLSSPDADATSFFARAGLTDPSQRIAVSKLVKDLKTAGLWSKWYCLYPFVGGTAASAACNLVSTNYTIAWSSGPAPVFSGLGVTGVTNSQGAYGDTHFNPYAAGVTQNDFSVFAYNLGWPAPLGWYGVFIGARADDNCRAGLAHDPFCIRVDGFMNCCSLQGFDCPAAADLRGPLLASRTSPATGVLYTDWLAQGVCDNTSSTGVPDANIYVLAKNDDGPYMPTWATVAMAGTSHGFSLQEWNRLRAICDNFNALLGRKAP